MADAIVRLRVESSEYDQKLSRATQQLQHMEKEVRRTGATFAYADKEELAMIKSLGSMETQATSAKGRMAELTKTFTELSIQYKNLTDEEKNSPFGQAMADSIGQIKGRIGDLGGQLNEVGAELKTTGGFIDTLADGLGQLGPVGQMAGKLLKGAFGPVGIAIAAVVGIIQQLVSAFKRNEDAMAGAARAAAPFKAIWQQIQQLFDRLVPYIAKGMETIANGMQSLFSKITDWMGKLSQTSIGKKLGLDTVYEQLKKVSSAQAELTESNKKIADSENALNKMRRSTETGNTQRRAQISELRFKASDKTNYSAEERVGFLEKAQELEGKTLQANLALRQKEYELIKLKNSLTKSGTEDLDAENAALNAITDARTEYNEHLRSTQRQLETARKEMEKESGNGTGTEDETPKVKNAAAIWEEYKQKITETTKRLEEFKSMMADTSLSDEQRDWAAGMADAYQEQLDKMTGATEEAANNMSESLDKIPTKFELMQESLDKMSTGVGAISTLGNSLNDLKGIGEDLASAFSGNMDAWDALMTVFNSGIGIMQTVMGVMEAINTLTQLSTSLKQANTMATQTEATTSVTAAATEAGAETIKAGANMATAGTAAAASSAEAGEAVAGIPIVGPILAVAAIAAVLAATFAAMSKAKSAGSFATGGLVPGSSFSGDNLTANVNSGELILNRAQQGTIAGQLQSNPMENLALSMNLKGEDIQICLDNNNRRRGRKG